MMMKMSKQWEFVLGGIGKLVCPCLVFLLTVGGCTYDGDKKAQSTTRPADAALKDPYGKWSNVDTDISGGSTSNLNRDALKRDMDSLFLK